jgi:hypothetical protein
VIEPLHALTTPFDVSPRGEILWVRVERGEYELWRGAL